MSIIKKVVAEFLLYIGYFFGAILLFGAATFGMLAFVATPASFSRTMIQEPDMLTTLDAGAFFLLLGLFFVMLLITIRRVWVRTYGRVWLRVLRMVVLFIVLSLGVVISVSNTINAMTHMVAGNRYSGLLPYEKRCPVYQKYIQEDELIGDGIYAIDRECRSVYWRRYRVDGADTKSFVPLGLFFAKDNNRAYFHEKSIDDADVKTMEKLSDPISDLTNTPGQVFFAYDKRFLYGSKPDTSKEKYYVDEALLAKKEKQQAFLEGIVFPGVVRIGHCEGFHFYDNRVRVPQSLQSVEDNLLSEDFTQANTKIEETEDCSVVTLDNGKTKVTFRKK